MSGEITFDSWMSEQTPEHLEAVRREYDKFLRREEDLKAVRQLLFQTQEELAAKLGTTQGAVSKLERRTDMSLKSLRAIVRHLGGELDIVVRLPKLRPIRLSRLSDLELPDKLTKKKERPTPGSSVLATPDNPDQAIGKKMIR